MNAHGNLIASDTIRFERLLPGPIERVLGASRGARQTQAMARGRTDDARSRR